MLDQELNQEQPDMTGVYKLTDKSKLVDFALNPRNIRSLESISIVPVTRVVNGVSLSEFGEDGARLGFELGQFQCSAEYRKKFNDYLNGLITIEGRKVKWATLPNSPILTTWKTAIEEGGPVKYWVLDGNTRFYILQQLMAHLESTPEELEVELHYSHYKGDLKGEALLFAAPTLGFNSFVPVLVPDTVQAEGLFKHLRSQGLPMSEALAQVKDTFLKSAKNPAGWSVAKLSYVTTELALGLGSGLLTDGARNALNTEFRSVYLRHWYTQVTGEKYRVGSEITPEAEEKIRSMMAQYGIECYIADTLRLPDFRLTSNHAWEAYLTWVTTKMEAPAPAQAPEQVDEPQVPAQSEEAVEPVTDSELKNLGENLYALKDVFHEMGEAESKATAEKLTPPLLAAVRVIAQFDPMGLEAILTAVAGSLESLSADKVGIEAAEAVRVALKKAAGINKALRSA